MCKNCTYCLDILSKIQTLANIFSKEELSIAEILLEAIR